jgi:hypothetical protein
MSAVVVRALLLVLVAAGGATAQTQQPPQQANICSTEWGWCPLPPGTVMVTGFPCSCTDPRTGRPLAGHTRAFNYTQYPRPVSPYLNPHWGL